VNRKQRRADEKAGRGAAGGQLPPGLLDQMFNQALGSHQAGRLQDAEAGYREVLARDARHAGALCYLGLLAHQSGHSDAGIDLLKKAIAADRRNAELHYNLACIYAETRRDDEAIAQTRKVLDIRPYHLEALGNLGALLLLRGQFAEALDVVMRGLKVEPTRSLKATFVLLAQSLDPNAIEHDRDFAGFLARALTEPWTRPRDLAGTAAALLMRDAAMTRAVAAASPQTEGHRFDDLFSRDDLARFQREGLLDALLTTSPVTSAAVERVLTAARRALLDAASTAAANPDETLAFACSLARQCFINDYIFAAEAGEAARVNELRGEVAATLAANRSPDPLKVAVLACYQPLHTLEHAERLASDNVGAAMRPLIAQQIAEPRQELAIRAAIASLTPVSGAVSEKVRQQYEESPYPKWTDVPAETLPMPLDHYIRMRLPGAPYKPVSRGAVNVLIAGCGTGQHAVQRALQIRDASVLAIDLSLSSLSYAIRKTQDIGVANIRYAQADILEFKSDTPFDVIDSSGVLHHLENPQEGWRRLAGLLRPGGLMHIGLYSEIARASINAARASIAARGAVFSADEARSLRAEIMALPPDDPLQGVTRFSDFFSMSEFRDLLFHVQEHQFSLPQIADFLRENGFTFLGFETLSRNHYIKRFPDDPAATDLAKWHVFETENPSTFAQMYQFWIQKN
jgi:2-polyprenyl-3-methyl-5-hydroxy-6-metoxy-1,4-benzoquinol methylase/tetratricopeptide (TPR) repeat protein